MNIISLTGRLTNDVELKSTPNGVSVCTFTIAVPRPRVKDTTDFIQCVAWRHTAEFIAGYFRKGKMIAINGVLTSRKYEDRNGNKRTAFEVIIENAEFCGDAKAEQPQKPADAPQNAPEDAETLALEELEKDDDLPF